MNTVAGEYSDDWLDGVAEKNLLFHWHGETFSLPEGAHNILQSAHCAHQAFVLDNILALQCHVEMHAGMVEEWVARYAQELTPTSATVQSPQQILQGLEEKIRQLQLVLLRQL